MDHGLITTAGLSRPFYNGVVSASSYMPMIRSQKSFHAAFLIDASSVGIHNIAPRPLKWTFLFSGAH